jgi:hypothetical protein
VSFDEIEEGQERELLVGEQDDRLKPTGCAICTVSLSHDPCADGRARDVEVVSGLGDAVGRDEYVASLCHAIDEWRALARLRGRGDPGRGPRRGARHRTADIALDEIRDFLHDLARWRLVHAEGDRYLALALPWRSPEAI